MALGRWLPCGGRFVRGPASCGTSGTPTVGWSSASGPDRRALIVACPQSRNGRVSAARHAVAVKIHGGGPPSGRGPARETASQPRLGLTQWRRAGTFLLDLALPATCVGCGREGASICRACLPALAVREEAPAGIPIGLPSDLPEPLLQLEWCA